MKTAVRAALCCTGFCTKLLCYRTSVHRLADLCRDCSESFPLKQKDSKEKLLGIPGFEFLITIA